MNKKSKVKKIKHQEICTAKECGLKGQVKRKILTIVSRLLEESKTISLNSNQYKKEIFLMFVNKILINSTVWKEK